jgi:hypothetical protein
MSKARFCQLGYEDETAAVLRGFAIMAIASPEFAYRACLASELGLLSLLLAGQWEEAAARASEILAALPVELPDDLEIQIQQAWTSARHALCSAVRIAGMDTDPAP